MLAKSTRDLIKEAKEHLQCKKYDNAISCLDFAIEINPNSSLCWFEKGKILYPLGKKEDALAAYTQAAQMKPTNKRYILGKALALRSLKRHTEALICFEYLMKTRSEYNTICYSNILFYMAESLEYLGRIDESIVINKKAWEMVSQQC